MNNAFSKSYVDDWDADTVTPPSETGLADPRRIPRSQRSETPLPFPASLQACVLADLRAPDESGPTLSVPHAAKPRHFPGFIARSALFGASAPRGDTQYQKTVKAQGCSLTATGPRLTMRDKHVWETAIQIAKERAGSVGEAFEVELRDFARRMGSSNTGGRALASLWMSLERLAMARVAFQLGPECKGVGSLIATAAVSQGKFYLRLNPDFAIPALLADKQFLFDAGRRSSLRSGLAQWLHDFYSTHKESRDMDLLYLRDLCGYDGPARNFPRKLEEAMRDLVEIAPELVASFRIDAIGRCSDAWKLRVVFGTETPSFIPPKRIPSGAQSGRGKVAL